MVQLLLECLELFRSTLHITFKFGSLLQSFQNFLTLLVIFEISLLHQCLKVIIISVRNLELFRLYDSRMFQAVLSCIIEYQIIPNQIKQDIRQLFLFDSNIRHHPASVAHFTSGSRIEHFRQTIRNSTYTSVFIPVFIVNSLHTAPAWNIIFGSSHFHRSSIRQRTGHLYQSFAKSTTADNYSTVKVLQRTRQNLRSRSCATIYQYSNRNIQIQRFT